MSKPREITAWAVAAAATLGMSVSYIDRQTLAMIAPSVTSALRIDNAHYGWLLSAFSMAYLAFAPIAGVIVDRVGARRGFVLAILAWSCVAASHALAFSFASLFLLRVLLGATESPSFPAAAQAIRRALPGARRPLAFGLLFTGSSIGAILAAKLAVPLDAKYGYQSAFLGTAVIGMLWLPVWLVATRGHGLDASVAPKAAVKEPWARVIFSPPVLRTVVAVVGSAPGLMFVLNWIAKYLVEAWGLPKASIGDLLIWPPIGFDIGAIGFGFLASMGKTTKTRVDLVLLSMVLAASLALVPFAKSPELAIAICAAAAIGGGGLYALVTADMFARVPVERTSAAGGVAASAQSIAHVIAGPLVGWSIDQSHSYRAALIALGVVVVPTTLAFVFWPGMRETEQPAE
jgi:ACS family hexuronate transporter-like MFS transporter